MNAFGSEIGYTTLGHEPRALNGKNDSRSRMRRMTVGCEPKALNAKNDSGLKAEMNDFGS